MGSDQDDRSGPLGSFIKAQRQLANLSLRQLSAMTDVSNAYLSQVERGLHQPSVRVLRSVANALNMSADTLLQQAGLGHEQPVDDARATEFAVQSDVRLTEPQKQALLSVYRSYIAANYPSSS
jgi:transcriptional regulator with XRE-family HTH domain